ncbi:hypothetical protein L7F22_053990 [Adiantum nelumboides]|nr:hypothetical protein [Adiantum nelumboides]
MASTSARPAATDALQRVDSDYLRAVISRLTIPQIKPLIKEVAAIAGVAAPSINGRKNHLVDSLHMIVDRLPDENQPHKYTAAIRAIEAKYGGSLSHGPRTSSGGATYQPNHTVNYAAPAYGMPIVRAQHPRFYGQHAYPEYYGTYPSAIQQQKAEPVAPKVGTFKKSPFYTLKEWIHPAVVCAQVPDHARPAGSAKISFNLTAIQCQDLTNPTSRKQARLFCTTYAASRASEANHPAPVEFPINCEVRVNRIQLSVNLRGRKGPAKVLPPNLNKDKKLNLSTGRNEVELTYINTHQPYILTIGICDTVSSEELVEKIKKESVKSKETVLKEMKRAADDDDIEVGDVTVNLKCPLSYMRLKTPCRSSVCTHIQCFDAFSFYSINEQTPSWQCPICSRTIDPMQIFVDGYVLNILQKVPESEETVQIDSEGRWKTPNNKFRSDNVAANEAATESASNTPSKSLAAPKENGTNSPLPPLPRVKGEGEGDPHLDLGPGAPSGLQSNEPSTTDAQQRNKKRAIDVVDLDDSPSPSGNVPQKETSEATNEGTSAQLSNVNISNGTSTQVAGGSSTTSAGDAIMGMSVGSTSTEPSRPAVIDLTFSDSDDDDQPLQRRMPVTTRPIAGLPTVRPPPIPSKPSDLANRMSLARTGPASVAPMPLPTPRLGNGMQSLDRFLIPRPQAGPSNGRPSSASSSDGLANAHRSSSFPNVTNSSRPFSEWSRNSPSWSNREADVARPRSGLQHSASVDGPTFSSGIFHAPSSPNAPMNPSRSETQPPSDPIVDEGNAPASSQTQDENENVDDTTGENRENAGNTPSHRTEDEDSDPVVRPRKKARHLNDAEDDEFDDPELDELDLDPDAGFATPNGHNSNQSNGNRGDQNGSSNHATKDPTDNLFNRGAKSGPIPYRNPRSDMDDLSDDDFEADERAGLGFMN